MQELSGQNPFSATTVQFRGTKPGASPTPGGSAQGLPGQDLLSKFKGLLGSALRINLNAPTLLPEGLGTRFSAFA